MAEERDGVTANGAAQPRQGPAVQDHRCQRLLHQPDPARRPLLDERAVPLADERLDKPFLEGAEARGLLNLKKATARSAACASIYNALGLDAVEALVAYMAEFEEGARLMADQDQLKALPLRIDSLDEKLLELISRRRCAQDVAQ